MSQALQQTLKGYHNADQYFLPAEICHWRDERRGRKYTPEHRHRAAKIGGVRVRSWPGPEYAEGKQCQYDLSTMIGALIEARKLPQHRQLILSNEATQAKLETGGRGRRLKFGLFESTDPKFADETIAAKACHRQILSGARKANYTITHPEEPFNPATGLKGLQDWAKQVRYAKTFPRWLYLLPLLLLFLLLFLIPKPKELMGAQIGRSFILIIDNSGSMESTLHVARSELRTLVENLAKPRAFWQKPYYANVIAFAGEAHSALGDIQKVTPENAAQLVAFLDDLGLAGGTRLQSGLELAAQEVQRHGRETTLIIITDAEDSSIPHMNGRLQEVASWFGDTPVVMNANTPGLMLGQRNQPNASEQNLAELIDHFNGRLGDLEQP